MGVGVAEFADRAGVGRSQLRVILAREEPQGVLPVPEEVQDRVASPLVEVVPFVSGADKISIMFVMKLLELCRKLVLYSVLR